MSTLHLRTFRSRRLPDLSLRVFDAIESRWIEVRPTEGHLQYWSRELHPELEPIEDVLQSVLDEAMARLERGVSLGEAFSFELAGWDRWMGNPKPLDPVRRSDEYLDACDVAELEYL